MFYDANKSYCVFKHSLDSNVRISNIFNLYANSSTVYHSSSSTKVQYFNIRVGFVEVKANVMDFNHGFHQFYFTLIISSPVVGAVDQNLIELVVKLDQVGCRVA